MHWQHVIWNGDRNEKHTSSGHPFWFFFSIKVSRCYHQTEEREDENRSDLQTSQEDCPTRSCMVNEQALGIYFESVRSLLGVERAQTYRSFWVDFWMCSR
jgi:hypothetical protein